MFSKLTALLGVSLCAGLLALSGESVAEQTTDLFACRGKSLDPAGAAALLREVKAAYGGLQSLSATFVQDSYLAALDVAERSSGEVSFKKPGRMKWEYRSPEPQTFLVRDTTVWFYQPLSKQVLVDEFRDVLISDLPVAFLMGLGSLEKNFSLKRACLEGESGILDLQPRGGEGDGELKGFFLRIDGKRNPIGARVVDVGGNVTTIALTDRKPNQPIEDGAFRADFPAGIDVNDQRVKKGA